MYVDSISEMIAKIFLLLLQCENGAVRCRSGRRPDSQPSVDKKKWRWHVGFHDSDTLFNCMHACRDACTFYCMTEPAITLHIIITIILSWKVAKKRIGSSPKLAVSSNASRPAVGTGGAAVRDCETSAFASCHRLATFYNPIGIIGSMATPCFCQLVLVHMYLHDSCHNSWELLISWCTAVAHTLFSLLVLVAVAIGYRIS